MRGAGKDESGRDLLYRYYGQLELLELRIPIDEEHARISFTWYDAFTQSPISQYSLAYEKACVLFNIVSILSFTAITQARSELDGMKKAYHSFQAAAGLLNFINDNFLHAPSTDLSREMVRTLSNIMLAQAQEVFTEKQIRDHGKPSIIAKLAAETSHLYHNANETLTEIVIAGNIDSVWGLYCQVKEKYFASIAHFQQACFEEEKGKYGVAVARFNTALNVMKEAMSAAKTNSGRFARYPSLSNEPGAAMLETIKASLAQITERAATAKRENDVIYHETPVKESAIPIVTRLSSAKPIALHDLYTGQDVSRIIGQDIFHKLVPLSVHESASMYSEEIARLLRDEQERSELADTKLFTALEYLGLPRSLHQFKVSDAMLSQDLANVPDTLLSSSAAITVSEKKEPVGQQLGRVQELRAAIAALLEQITQKLDEESRQCDKMRVQYPGIWTQRESAAHTASLREDLRKYKLSLDAAEEADSQMRTEFETHRTGIEQMSRGEDNLLSAFKAISMASESSDSNGMNSLLDLQDTDTTADIAIQVDQVDDALRKINLVKKERLQTLQDLKERARKDDISQVLILNKRTPGIEQRVFQAELEKFRPHRTRISATISRQEQLLEEITTTFSSVLDRSDMMSKRQRLDAASRERASMLDALQRAATAYQGISAGVSRALHFYKELERLVKNTSMQANAFIRERQQEGRQMLEGISGQMPSRGAESLRDQFDRMSLERTSSSRPQPAPPSPYERRY